MKLSKWTYELIIVAVLVCVGLGVWWFITTKDERATNADTKAMIKYAQRQALEIAIIEQASKLTDYRQQLAAAKQPVAKPIAPTPPMTMPLMPEVADPKDVDVNR